MKPIKLYTIGSCDYYERRSLMYRGSGRRTAWLRNAGKFRPYKIEGPLAIEVSCAKFNKSIAMYPEQCYNKIKKLEELEDGDKVTPILFNIKANNLEYDDIGENIKNGYLRYSDETWHKQELAGIDDFEYRGVSPDNMSWLIDISNKYMNQNIKDLPLMLDKDNLSEGINTPLNLIYGVTDKTKLFVDNTGSRRPWDRLYKHYLKLRHRSGWSDRGYEHGFINIKDSKGKSSKFRFLAVRVEEVSLLTEVQYKLKITYHYFRKVTEFMDVMWRSVRQARVAIFNDDNKMMDAFVNIELDRGQQNENAPVLKYVETKTKKTEEYEYARISENSTPFFYISNCTYGSNVYTRNPCNVGIERYHEQLHRKTSTLPEKHKDYITSVYIDSGEPYKEERKLDFYKDTSSHYNSVTNKNINSVVLLSLVYSRFELYSITDESKFFQDIHMPLIDEVRQKNIGADFSKLLPELSYVGQSMVLKMIKKIVLDNMTIRPKLMDNDVIISDIHIEELTYLPFWLVYIFVHIERVSLKDLDYYPYFIDRPKDKNGDIIPTIRLDIGRGVKCEFIVPKLTLMGNPYNPSGFNKDDIMVALNRYIQVISPLIDDMKEKKISILDYCYPIIDLTKHVFPRLYSSFEKNDVPVIEKGLEHNVKIALIERIINHTKEVVMVDPKHEFNPVTFQRRVTFKELGVWDKMKNLDFSEVVLPKLSKTSVDSPVKYEILKNGKYEGLDKLSVGDKLDMLQDVTNLLTQVEDDDTKVQESIHAKYIIPIVNSIKFDDKVQDGDIKNRIDDMLTVKSKLDYMRDVELSFLIKRKETLVSLFQGQKQTLSRVLKEDKEYKDAFIHGLVLTIPNRKNLKFPELEELNDATELSDQILTQHEIVEKRKDTKSKLGWTMLGSFTAGIIVKKIYKSIKGRNK